MSNLEWMKAKANKVLREQVERVIAQSAYPDSSLANGMLEGYCSVGLVNEGGRNYWRERLETAVTERRAALRRLHNQQLVERRA
ncbi:MAG: hypothetical protein ACKVIS_22855 [Pseudomonadales bacterium]